MSFKPARFRNGKGSNGVDATLDERGRERPISPDEYYDGDGKDETMIGPDGQPRRRGRPKGSKNKATLEQEAVGTPVLTPKVARDSAREQRGRMSSKSVKSVKSVKSKSTLAAETAAVAMVNARERAKSERQKQADEAAKAAAAVSARNAVRNAARRAAAAAARIAESTSGGSSSSENESDEDDSLHEPYILGQRFPAVKATVGLEIEAVDATGYWYAATIKGVDTKARKVLVHYSGWSRRHDMWLPRDTPKIRDIGARPVKMPATRPTRVSYVPAPAPPVPEPAKKKSHHKGHYELVGRSRAVSARTSAKREAASLAAAPATTESLPTAKLPAAKPRFPRKKRGSTSPSEGAARPTAAAVVAAPPPGSALVAAASCCQPPAAEPAASGRAAAGGRSHVVCPLATSSQ